MLITSKDISLQINQKTILDNISFNFEQDKIYGIIGPNGAGKSSFLKIITGFVKPTSGEVYFQERIISEPQQNIAIVWQKPYMLHTTVYKNLAYGLKIRGLSKGEIRKKVDEVIDLFELSYIMNDRAVSLSGGETAKVAIARAVATSPDLLILDEPTASLDPKNVLDIEKIISNLNQKYNMTIIFVTHNMFQAKRIADETLFFHNGRLIEIQPTTDLFAKPLNILTKEFISGEGNF